ncbi:MAG: methionine biosynthesis protein MetW [Candidatus Portnoybacteria bacterium RBG_13_40_8]|uniref:Methionine biosynthesis protein MetW n=1 Tax=Candidatus Portnoybacteria bacterium RBG_13_40_8 TaxID=1801990 RepID=A0A1G2F5I7_9BACT|nr:MAG: methionine biosynthesis protein MetW [Deltaproteobacteria bacterium RBG_16_44_11]OGZ33243.1 MAG: methionine biosynthesis protein MetW [Candidatus Portnoybacteria bacterium RBG_13_40_8]
MKADHQIISQIISAGAHVLDLGCGSGELLAFLTQEKKALVQGIELDEDQMHQCVERGLTVLQGDIESGLVDYPDKSFDFVILNQIMQEIKKADFVIQESLRVGKRVIVGFPNFAHITARLTLLLAGKTPINEALPHYWFETPNIRFLTINDFIDYCSKKNIIIEQKFFLGKSKLINFLPNLLALNALFVITKK